MAINRRRLIKNILMSPLYGFASSLVFSRPSFADTDYYNFFIHGLFFMELITHNGKPALEIKAPKVSGHVLLGGARKNLNFIQDVDFTSLMPDLPSTTPTIVKPNPIPLQVRKSVLQFSRAETGVGNLKAYDPSVYLGRIILPWPDDFYSLRADNFPYPGAGISTVADKVKNRCGGSKIGTVTCIQYPYKIPGSLHFHMLACEQEDVCHVDHALTEASKIFANPSKFDFQIGYGMSQTPVDNNPPVTGAIPEDENSAQEDEPNWQKWCSNVTPSDVNCPKNVSPANCPSFFVG
jgi:hypothetical protein